MRISVTPPAPALQSRGGMKTTKKLSCALVLAAPLENTVTSRLEN
jgi:hypothetical protein